MSNLENTTSKPQVDHNENVVVVGNNAAMRRLSQNPDFEDQAKAASNVAQAERHMGLVEALKMHPKAAMWSVILSTAIIMEGYDVVLLGSLYAFPSFQRKYGVLQPDGSYQLEAKWQSALSNGACVGEIIGLFLNGYVSEWIGYRKTMISSLLAVTGFIFIPFFAQNVEQLLAGEILCGIPWGVFQTLTTAYASEVCPTALRAYLTTYVNLCWVLGQLIASGVLRGLVHMDNQWGYRIPFALQWFWPIPIIIGCLLAPESPWWLVRQGREKDAKKALSRLTTQKALENGPSIEETYQMIVHTNELEAATSSGTNYWHCFMGVDLRRTEITCMVWIIQVTCGSGFMGYSTYFYEQAGLNVSNAFTMSMGQYAIGAIGTFLAWALMGKYGRRTLYLAGLVGMNITLIIIGVLGILPSSNTGASWGTGSMLLLFTFIYDVTVGPVCYALVAEMSSTRLRTKTIVLARNCYNVFGIINNFLIPAQINPSAWNWRGKSGFFWAGVGILSFIWTYFRLPEPKGRTYAEMDMLFENKVPARQFSSTKVDLGAHVHGASKGDSDVEIDEKPVGTRSPSINSSAQ